MQEETTTPVLDFFRRICNFLGNAAHFSHNIRHEHDTHDVSVLFLRFELSIRRGKFVRSITICLTAAK